MHALSAMSIVCWIRCALACHGNTLGSLISLLVAFPEGANAVDLAGRRTRFYGYLTGAHRPAASLVQAIDDRFEGTRQILEHVVWTVLAPEFDARREGSACLGRVHPDVLRLVVRKDPLGYNRLLRCEQKLLMRRLSKIEGNGSLDAIACFVILIKLAVSNSEHQLAFHLGHALCRTMLLAGDLLTRLGVAQPLADFMDEYVLPLASYDGLAYCFGSGRYTEAIGLIRQLEIQKEATIGQLSGEQRGALRLNAVNELRQRGLPTRRTSSSVVHL